jgi:hypothetical protein
MKVLSSLICQTSILDEGTKNISIINVIDRLQIALEKDSRSEDGLLRLPFSFELITHLYGDDMRGKTYQIKFETCDPEGRVLATNNLNEAFVPKDKSRFRLITKVAGITVSKQGIYMMRTTLQEKNSKSELTVIDTPLDVFIDIKK